MPRQCHVKPVFDGLDVMEFGDRPGIGSRERLQHHPRQVVTGTDFEEYPATICSRAFHACLPVDGLMDLCSQGCNHLFSGEYLFAGGSGKDPGRKHMELGFQQDFIEGLGCASHKGRMRGRANRQMHCLACTGLLAFRNEGIQIVHRDADNKMVGTINDCDLRIEPGTDCF